MNTKKTDMRLMDAKEVAELMGLNVQTLYRLVRENCFAPAVRVGTDQRLLRWRESSIVKWLDEREASNQEIQAPKNRRKKYNADGSLIELVGERQ